MAKKKASKRTKRSPAGATELPGGRKKGKKRHDGGDDAEATKARWPALHQLAFPVVGIGASAGGLEALQELFRNMPPDTGMAFVVVTHQHPGHTSMLPELLNKATEMKVVEAQDGTQLEPNHVYVGPPGGHLAILHGTLQRLETSLGESPKLPIDYFFRSLAQDQQERAVGLILSGSGTDGTLGVAAIKGESGRVIVEQPQSAKYAGMPSSAIATGLADFVLPPAAIPKQLMALTRSPYAKIPASAAAAPSVPSEPMQKIVVLLRSRTGHDFSAYKSKTLHRRIERRMNVHQISKPNQYVRFLQGNPQEIDILFKELLISVTNFFRDPQAWDSLSSQLDEMIASRKADSTVRVWVPGCATGEEVFSLAIALRECMDRVNRRLDVQVFGTDLDAQAIEIARVGNYPDAIAVDVSPKRLEQYFTHADGVYRIRKEIREMAIFAPQNMIKDPPFTKLDMISCRNLLIYLNADLQKRLLPIFHYALKPNGLLFLGPSETVGGFTDIFEALDKRWKIFRRSENVGAIHVLPEMPAQPLSGDEGESAAAGHSVKESHITTVIERMLLDRFAPACVVTNDRGEILYVHGRTGAYLELTQGQPRHNLLEMARDGLQIELSAAMRQSCTENTDVIRENIRVRSNGDSVQVNLGVARIKEPSTLRGLLLVTFRPPPTPGTTVKSKTKRKKAQDTGSIEQLGRELQYLRESQQITLEELETSNEELKSTNEELQSTNEELQSMNEELETSKEEMQSLNEELTTVNTELYSKVEELSQVNNDMQNLLNSTEIATIFVDNDLNIKRFTERSTRLVTLRPTDVGRPITDLASKLKFDGLTHACREVLRTLVYNEQEIETTDGGWYSMRIMPYRTAENAIDGLVLTFVSIKQLKNARAYFESIFDTVRQPLIVLDDNHRVVSANQCFCDTFQLHVKQIEGTPLFELGDGEFRIPKLRELLEEILPDKTTLENYLVDFDFPQIGRKVFMLNARRLRQEAALPHMILLSFEDVTEKHAE